MNDWINTCIKKPDMHKKVFLLYREVPYCHEDVTEYDILKIKVGTYHEYLHWLIRRIEVIFWRSIPENWNESIGFPEINLDKLDLGIAFNNYKLDESICKKTETT